MWILPKLIFWDFQPETCTTPFKSAFYMLYFPCNSLICRLFIVLTFMAPGGRVWKCVAFYLRTHGPFVLKQQSPSSFEDSNDLFELIYLIFLVLCLLITKNIEAPQIQLYSWVYPIIYRRLLKQCSPFCQFLEFHTFNSFSQPHSQIAVTIQVYSSCEILSLYLFPNNIFLNFNFFILFFTPIQLLHKDWSKNQSIYINTLTELRFLSSLQTLTWSTLWHNKKVHSFSSPEL